MTNPENRRCRTVRDLSVRAVDRLDQERSVEREDDSATDITIAQDRMRARGVRRVTLVEQQKPSVGEGTGMRRISGFSLIRLGCQGRQDVVYRVGTAAQHEVDAGVRVRRGTHDDTADSQAFPRKNARLPPARSIGPARSGPSDTDRCRRDYSRTAIVDLGRWDAGQEVRRERCDRPDRIVELLGVGMREPKDHAPVAIRGDGCDATELPRQSGTQMRVASALEGEHDVPRCDWDTVLPLRALVEIEDQRDRVATSPSLRQHGNDDLSPGRNQLRSEIGEVEKEVVRDLDIGEAVGGTFH